MSPLATTFYQTDCLHLSHSLNQPGYNVIRRNSCWALECTRFLHSAMPWGRLSRVFISQPNPWREALCQAAEEAVMYTWATIRRFTHPSVSWRTTAWCGNIYYVCCGFSIRCDCNYRSFIQVTHATETLVTPLLSFSCMMEILHVLYS